MATVCEEMLERASLTGNEDAEVASHLMGCGGCREKVRGLRLLAATRPEPSHQVLVGFAARTRAKLAKQESGAGLFSPLRAAVLAGAVAAAGAGGVLFGLDTPSPTVATTEVPGGSVAAAPAAAPAAATDELFRLELLADPVEPFEQLYGEELYARGADGFEEDFDVLFEGEEG